MCRPINRILIQRTPTAGGPKMAVYYSPDGLIDTGAPNSWYITHLGFADFTAGDAS